MAPVVLRIPAGVHAEARHLAITSSVGMATRSCCILRRSYIGPRYELTKLLGSLKRGLRAELGEVVKSGVDVAVSVGHSALSRRGTCTEGNLPKRELDRGVGVAPVSDRVVGSTTCNGTVRRGGCALYSTMHRPRVFGRKFRTGRTGGGVVVAPPREKAKDIRIKNASKIERASKSL